MSYLLDKKIRKNKYFKYAIFFVILFIFIYFRSGIYRGFSTVSSVVFRPVLVLGNKIGDIFSGTGSYFSSKKSLLLENENLKNQLSEISNKESNYDTVLNENLSMKEALGRKNLSANMILGSILSKPNQSPYDTLIIDLGAKDGIIAKQRVFAIGNVPIGYISEVYPSSSKVVLYSNPGEKTEVIVPLGGNVGGESVNPIPPVTVDTTSTNTVPVDSTNPETIIGKDTFMQVIGRGGGNFEMILPRDAVMKKGAEAVLPGITPYTIGIVQTIISDPRDAFQKALLMSPVNIQDIKFVEVEK